MRGKQVYPEVAVGTFVINGRGELLLVRSWKWPNLYGVPGGHVELGESIAQTAVRETMEEVGLKVKFKHIINMQEAIFPKTFKEKRHFIFIDVMCTTSGGKVKMDGVEIESFVWIKPRAALRLRLNTYTRRAVNDIVNNRKLKTD